MADWLDGPPAGCLLLDCCLPDGCLLLQEPPVVFLISSTTTSLLQCSSVLITSYSSKRLHA
eukprot:2829141-Heterocapsa_arctica.AAC.1